jgi:hypothetical protein
MSTDTIPEPHRHLVYGSMSHSLQVAWCQCGATLDLKKDPPTWGPPKHHEGTERAKLWRYEE